MMKGNPNRDDFCSTDASGTIAYFFVTNQFAIEFWFKIFAEIINLAKKCGKIIHIKGFTWLLSGNNRVSRLPFNLFNFCLSRIHVMFKLFPLALLICHIATAHALTPEQQLLLTPKPMPAHQRNGYSALYLVSYNIPTAQHDATVQAYGQQLQKIPTIQAKRVYYHDDFSCKTPRDIDACIQNVRAQLPFFQRELNQHRALLANLDQLSQAQIIYPPQWAKEWQAEILDENFVFPEYPFINRYALVASITEWQSGKPKVALARSCRQIRTGKLLANTPMGLIASVVGSVTINSHVQLIARILAQQPQLAHDLPNDCQHALEPLPESDVSLCESMKAEYRFAYNSFTALANQASGLEKWTYQALMRSHADYFAYFCRPAVMQFIRQDQAINAPQPKWATLLSHYQFGENTLTHDIYPQRMQDTQAYLRALNMLLTLHRQTTPPTDAEIRALLAQYSTPYRAFTWNAERQGIEFPLHRPYGEDAPDKAFLPFKY